MCGLAFEKGRIQGKKEYEVDRLPKVVGVTTVNDFIKKLQALKPSLRELPVFTVAPNGLYFEPKIKWVVEDYCSVFDTPTRMIITYT
jgi:hypothetical protein